MESGGNGLKSCSKEAKQLGLTQTETIVRAGAVNLARLLPGKCVSSVMHDAIEVVDFSQRVHLPRLHLQKVILLS